MEKKRITYGVVGFMEYQAVVQVGGRNTMRVNFTDGSLTAMSTNPATYTTENYMIQHAIENSSDYKRGLIKKIREVGLGCEVKVEHGGKAMGTGSAEPVTEPAAEPVTEPADEGTGQAAEITKAATELKQVTVHCNDDAKDYLADNCGVVRSKLRSRADITAAGEAAGVEFIFE